jgi:hypothetical protein
MTRRDFLSRTASTCFAAVLAATPLALGGCSQSEAVFDAGPGEKNRPKYKELHPEEFPGKKAPRRARKGR